MSEAEHISSLLNRIFYEAKKMAQAKKSSKYVSCETYDPKDGRTYEEVGGQGMTIEGEAYTIRELMARHMNMNLPDVEKEGFFEDTEDFDFPDLSKLKQMDIFDRMDLYGRVEDKMRLAQKKLEAYQKEKEAEDAAALEAEVKRRVELVVENPEEVK